MRRPRVDARADESDNKGDAVSIDMEALQTILSCCDENEHLGGRLYKFTFDGVIAVEIVAQSTNKGWRVVSVYNSEREFI